MQLSIQEKLEILKQKVVARSTRYEFSSYLEYLCNKPIGDFTEAEINLAAQKFLPTIEQIAIAHNSARRLKKTLSFHSSFQLNFGASILGFCAITPQFVNNIRRLPEGKYWAIWFCIELLQYSAVNDIDFLPEFVRTTKSDTQQCIVPTGHVISFFTIPVSLESHAHPKRLNIIELVSIETESQKDNDQEN